MKFKRITNSNSSAYAFAKQLYDSSFPSFERREPESSKKILKCGEGLGKKALKLLCLKNKPVILETDPPEDVISIKRKRFYENCGFKENPYFHVHPRITKTRPGMSL